MVMNKRRKRIYIGLMLLCLLMCFTSCSKKKTEEDSKQSTSTEEVKKYSIPNVVGMTSDKAKELLDKAGIEYKIQEEYYNQKYDKGIVYQQSAVGESDVASVELQISKGLTYTIDNLSGKKYKDIKKKLKLFKKIKEYSFSEEYGEGVVMYSTFSNATVCKGDSGEITISMGKYSDKNVKGKNVESAKKQFPNAKFKVKYKLSSASRGAVLSYSVGESDSKNKIPVTFVVSDGLLARVPDLTGKSESKAKKILDKKGVKYNVEYCYYNIKSKPISSKGTVYDQSKKGKINKRKAITLTVNKPAITISGMTIDFNDFDGVNTKISFINESNKAIASIDFCVAYYNRVGQKVDEASLNYVGPLYEYGEETASWEAAFYNRATAAEKPKYADIKFMDGRKQRIVFSGIFWHTSEYVGSSYLPD